MTNANWQQPHPDPSSIRERYLWVARNESAPTLSIAIGHGGAGAAAWAEVFPDGPGGANLAAIRLPGRESRVDEPLSYEVEPLGAETATTIASLLGEHRLVMAGVCFGAVVAYAAARQLAGRFGIRPAALIAVDTGFGSTGEPKPPSVHDSAFAQFIEKEGFLPDWVWSDTELSAMLLGQFHADMSAHLSYLWPDCDGPVAEEVVVVTGRQIDAASATTWKRAADRVSVIDGGTYPHNLLIDHPVRLGQIISGVVGAVPRADIAGTDEPLPLRSPRA